MEGSVQVELREAKVQEALKEIEMAHPIGNRLIVRFHSISFHVGYSLQNAC